MFFIQNQTGEKSNNIGYEIRYNVEKWSYHAILMEEASCENNLLKETEGGFRKSSVFVFKHFLKFTLCFLSL